MWGPDHKFTLAEYVEYKDLPEWALDSPDFLDKLDYYEHWDKTIIDWVHQAKDYQENWKNICRQSLDSIEEMESAHSRNYSIENTLAYKPLELAHAHIQENTAMLCINTPQGQIVSTQESMNKYVSALNQLVDGEEKANNAEQITCDTVYTGQFYNLGWWKTSVDYTQYGNFGQKGKIIIEEIEPDNMHVDPKAKQKTWDYVDFIIQEREHEIGDIRQAYPIAGFEIDDSSDSSRYSSLLDTRASQDKISSPLPNLAKGPSTKRQRLRVYECWFKDSRLKFAADTETQERYDDVGQKYYNVDAPVVDDEGHVIGEWKPRFPRGRCIVICEAVVLEDMPNRLPHGRCPFIPVPLAPSKKLFTPGKAVRLIAVADKINDLLSRAHSYAQSEIERPMHAEFGSFANNQLYKKVPNKSNKIVLLSQGKSGTFLRPPPVELPQFLWEMLQKYEGYMDLIAGSSAVMRGTISDGAQISAEALASLQTFASSRVALEAKYLAGAVKERRYQVMWLVRATYDENIEVQVSLPDGTVETINWASDRAIFEEGDETAIAELTSKESCVVEIKAGTGTPNASQARQSMADHLFDRKAINRRALLDAYEYPDRQNIDKEIQESEKQDIAAEAAGRRLGMNITKIERKADGPGRREGY